MGVKVCIGKIATLMQYLHENYSAHVDLTGMKIFRENIFPMAHAFEDDFVAYPVGFRIRKFTVYKGQIKFQLTLNGASPKTY